MLSLELSKSGNFLIGISRNNIYKSKTINTHSSFYYYSQKIKADCCVDNL